MRTAAQPITVSIHGAQARFLDSAALFRGFVGGRGAGKSFIGAYDLLKRAKPKRLYLAGAPTFAMLKDASWRALIEQATRLNYVREVNRSDLRLTLGNGAEVLGRSADEPNRWRGLNLSGAWLDEASQMERAAQEVVIASLREGGEQGWLSATFTPRGRAHWTYDVFATDRPNTELVHARTTDNPFLPAEFYATVRQQYTSFLAQQELEGLFISDVEGALWRQAWLDSGRVHKAPPLVRVVVAVDPAVTHNDASDPTGIAVAGIGDDGHYYVLHGAEYRLSPDGWARRTLDLYDQHSADRIIAERNNGGEMVESTLRNVRPLAPVSTIVASKGKAVRAEPIAALYEQCLAGGTLVETARGLVPIERVTTADWVWTRLGLRRVLWSGQTGISETIRLRGDGVDMVCTATHPVHTARGFIHAALLVPNCDILTAWKSLGVRIAESQSLGPVGVAGHVQPSAVGQHRASHCGRSSCSRESGISSRKMDTTARDDTAAGNYFTAMCGKRPTDESLKTGTCITSTATPATTRSITLLPLPPRAIQNGTTIKARGSRLLEQLQARLERPGGNAVNRRLMSAMSADGTSPALLHEFDSVLLPVTRTTTIAAVEPAPKQPVYNLEVQGEPEFFANGALVHNCRVHHVGTHNALEEQMCLFPVASEHDDMVDALVYALTDLVERTPGRVRVTANPFYS